MEGDEQALQQFLSQSPWDWEAVRRPLALQMMSFVPADGCWVVDDIGFPKKGEHSVGVARQYSGTLGKVSNCQIGVSLNYATEDACFPLDFQLYLPEKWTQDAERCNRASIPQGRKLQTKWQLAVEMIDRALGWGVNPGTVIADSGYGIATNFRQALRSLNLTYVVGIGAETGFWLQEIRPDIPRHSGGGRPRTRDCDLPDPQSVVAIARQLPEDAWQQVTWRQGSKGPLANRFAAVRAQPPHGHGRGKVTESMGWLLIEWPEDADAPAKFWVSNPDETTSLRQLVYWAKLRWWVEQNYQQMKTYLGLDHFEGRSWQGWHHHVTFTMIAFNFLVLEALRTKKDFWVDPPRSTARDCDGEILLLQLDFCPMGRRRIEDGEPPYT